MQQVNDFLFEKKKKKNPIPQHCWGDKTAADFLKS